MAASTFTNSKTRHAAVHPTSGRLRYKQSSNSAQQQHLSLPGESGACVCAGDLSWSCKEIKIFFLPLKCHHEKPHKLSLCTCPPILFPLFSQITADLRKVDSSCVFLHERSYKSFTMEDRGICKGELEKCIFQSTGTGFELWNPESLVKLSHMRFPKLLHASKVDFFFFEGTANLPQHVTSTENTFKVSKYSF